MLLKTSSFSCDNSEDEHLNSYGTTKNQTITFVFAYVMVHLTPTNELHVRMHPSKV